MLLPGSWYVVIELDRSTLFGFDHQNHVQAWKHGSLNIETPNGKKF